MSPDNLNTSGNRKKSSNDWTKMLPGLSISLLALIAILFFVDFNQLADAVQKAHYGLLTIGFSTSIIWLLVRAAAWRYLLANKPKYSDTFFAVNEGYLLNNLLPLRLGEMGRAFLLGRKHLPTLTKTTSTAPPFLGFWRVFSSVIVERVLDMAFGVTVLLVALPFVINLPQARAAAQTSGVIVIIGVLTLYVMARNPQRVLTLFDRLTARSETIHRMGNNTLSHLLEGLSVFTDWQRFAIAVGWIALNWLIGLMQFYLLLKAFIPDAPLLWAVFTLGMVAVGGTIPSSPGNIGVLEGVVIFALGIFTVDKGIALAYGIAVHLTQVVSTTIFGIYGLSREGETLTSIYQQIRHQQKTRQGR